MPRRDSDARKRCRHYRRLLAGYVPQSGLEQLEVPQDSQEGDLEHGLEGFETSPEIDLSDEGIRARIQSARVTLLDVVDTHLGGGEGLRRIARELLEQEACERALKSLRDDYSGGDGDPVYAEDDLLEAIVQTDGSRPSFMVREGRVDPTTSPIGTWAPALETSEAALITALECVGRIDDPTLRNGFAGTGFLVHENLILTNRHVLELIGEERDGAWSLRSGLRIDFGHEFKSRQSLRPRELARVVFAGPERILGRPIDHTRLDLALIELAPATDANHPPSVLSIDTAPDWTRETVYIVGYPARPRFGMYGLGLLEQLFQSTFGCKRVAPGLVSPTAVSTSPAWKLNHDATTLGGNSGSVVLLAGSEGASVAVHYGGRNVTPRENWAQKIELVLDEVNGTNSSNGHARTLREHLQHFDVTFTQNGGWPARGERVE